MIPLGRGTFMEGPGGGSLSFAKGNKFPLAGRLFSWRAQGGFRISPLRALQTTRNPPETGCSRGPHGPRRNRLPRKGTDLIKVGNNSPYCTVLCGSGRQPSGLRAAPGRLKGVRGCMRGPKGEDRNSPWPPHKTSPLPKGISGGNLPLIP